MSVCIAVRDVVGVTTLSAHKYAIGIRLAEMGGRYNSSLSLSWGFVVDDNGGIRHSRNLCLKWSKTFESKGYEVAVATQANICNYIVEVS